MGSDQPPYLKIKYRNKIIILIALLTTVLLSTASFLLFRRQGSASNATRPITSLTRQILQRFNLTASPGNDYQPVAPQPTQSAPPTPANPSLTPPKITPPRLNTTDPDAAANKLEQTISEMASEGLATSAIERYQAEAQELLRQSKRQQALEKIEEGYNLAQEILIAARYYRNN